MRHYELMVILDPSLDERTVALHSIPSSTLSATTVERLTTSTSGASAVLPTDRQAQRGIYAVIDLNAEPATVNELDRQLKLNDSVLRTKVLRK